MPANSSKGSPGYQGRRFRLVGISVKQIAKTAEDRPALTPAAAGRRCGLVDAIGHAAERQRLQPHATRACQRGVEQSFAAEQRRLDLPDILNVVTHRWLKRDEATSVNSQSLSRTEVERVNSTAGMHEAEAIAFELLHDESLTAEQPDTD